MDYLKDTQHLCLYEFSSLESETGATFLGLH